MEAGDLVKVKAEPINLDTDEPDYLPNKDENIGIPTEKEAIQQQTDEEVLPVQSLTPPYYTQSHIVGGKWEKPKEKKQYNCKTCKFKFTSKAWLIKHEKMHERMENKAKLYKCEICRKEFSQKIIHHDHMAAHAGRRPYVCDRCGMDFTWYRAFYRHQQSHKTGGKGFSCHLCRRTFNSNWNLSRHLKVIHLSKQTFRCDICEELFEKKNLYQIHMKAHHREEKKKRKIIGIVNETVKQKHLKFSKAVRAMMQSQSQNNSKQANNQGSLVSFGDEIAASELIEEITDISKVEDTNDTKCNSYDEDSSVQVLQKLNEAPKIDDNSVNKTDADLEDIQDQGIKYSIGKTSKSTAKSSVISNLKLSQQPYACGICGKRVFNLDAHMRIHSGDKPFRCCLCDKDFAQREALKIHYRSHTGEKPFICNTCGKGFATRGLQQDHVRSHRGDKPYQCDACDARFSWRCALSRHKQLHSTGPKPHACSICTFECWRKHDLTKHEKTHLNDRYYKCDFINCTAFFSNKKHLVKHKKEHKCSNMDKTSLNGRMIRMKTAKGADDTDKFESDVFLTTDIVDIKQEPTEELVDDDLHNMSVPSTASMYITSNEGQMETLVTHRTDPDSGKLRYTKGKRLHLDRDLQLLLNKKLNEKKTVKSRNTKDGLSGKNLKSKLEGGMHNEPTRQSSKNLGFEGLKRKSQVNISMDNVVENDGNPMKGFDKFMSSSNMVCCEVCGKSLNISYYHIHVRKHMEEMAHTCEICNKSFSRKTDLVVHSRVHTNIRPFKCTICPKAFKVKSLLEDHIRSHDGIKPYVCSLCDASFAWRCALHRHVKTHSINKPFQCDVCGKDFRRRRDWVCHMEKKTCKFVKSIIYKCNDCQAVFANLETLVYHNEKYHKETSLTTADKPPESQTILNSSSDKLKEFSSPEPYSDDIVDEDTLQEENDTIDELNESIQARENVATFQQTNTRKDVNPPSDSVLLPNNKYDETYSEEASGNKTDITLSENLNSFIKKESIDSDSMFISSVVNSADLMEDSRSPSNTHNDTQTISQQDPDHVDKTTLPSSNFSEFSFTTWTGEDLQIKQSNVNGASNAGAVEDKLKCKICSRSFVSSIGLKVHLRIHSKDAMDIYALHFRPDEMMTKSKREKEARNLRFKCKLCDKTFPFASGLRIHMMAHSGKLPYNCKTCGKRFPYLESVKSHMRVHTGERPFTCDVCGKSFAYRHNHDDHYRTHTGDKPYKCDRCDSAFTWKSALHRHHKTHSLESLEVCTICKAKFKNGGQLVRHMNRFHSSLV
ncbi:zinc finger protein Xfin-like [Pecten maximus]|uniref:zinc finger protein Xfin-like n=1 Tax=Pecten maximus TaxID=6579 RepID=UPI0014582ECC|nr:zinc finger protein Xfin-like [Pecten maximus]